MMKRSDLYISSYGMTHCPVLHCLASSPLTLLQSSSLSLIINAQVVVVMTSVQFWEVLSPVTGRPLNQTLPHLSMSPPAR